MHLLYFMAVFLLYFTAATVAFSGPPEISTPLGKVQGYWKTSYDGRPYAAFEGIPYAKPPVGQLRFEEPQPIQPWIGTWNATEPYMCVQNSMDLSTITGNEDCLYVDVFVPVTDERQLNVVVHIHGGGFVSGKGLEYVDPKYVMDRDLIFITLNYRLGPLGFLSTNDEVVPGNNGIKDQVLALKWVQQNIASFGGNPNSVTLTGFSAGAASVHLHYFSPLSKGLFHRGMSLSGTAANAWVITERATERAHKLASLVGCPVSNTRKLVDCLKTRPAELLLKSTRYLYDYPPAPLNLFCPVVEQKSENPFILEHPLTMLREKKVLDVPWITSVTRNEGETLGIMLVKLFQEMNERWEDIAPHVLHYEKLAQRKDVLNKIKEFYLGHEGEFSLDRFDISAKIFTDFMLTLDAEYAAKLQSRIAKSPVYFYFFNYDKGENALIDFPLPDQIESGVPHGTDMIYFFGGGTAKPLSKSDIKLKNACLDMLYHYAEYGVPSFEGIKWEPTSGEDLIYLNITGPEDIKLQTTTYLSTGGKFWNEIKPLLGSTKDEL